MMPLTRVGGVSNWMRPELPTAALLLLKSTTAAEPAGRKSAFEMRSTELMLTPEPPWRAVQ